eukprot:TRINITY_DN6771_c0_g2_i1.p1 TRINITY_DN6771_c0_g2~~TRINITY_DN6771_c0_g2_i1.p1  ORF type:complete len:423 (+),score=51.13 TRINITY_DN6771_c0_g2_i1:3-1271(+)
MPLIVSKILSVRTDSKMSMLSSPCVIRVIRVIRVCVCVCVSRVRVTEAYRLREESSEPEVDIVIPASCQKDVSIIASSESPMVERDRDNDELTYTLRSIAKNAPWVHKIYVLQNPECKDIWKAKPVAEPDKTVWVNRCGLLPLESCPTRNSCVVQTVVHKIPNLSEHFIYTDDDNLLIKPSTISTFFRNSEDAWLPKVPKYQGSQAIYSDISAVRLQVQEMPMKMPGFAHCWQPLLKSAATQFERSHTQFMNFVRSHRTGRYSSELNEYGTTESERANSLEEYFQGIWWWWMHKKNVGSEILNEDEIESKLFTDSRIGTWTLWDSMFSEPSRMILNINDDLNTNDDSVYQRQHQDAIIKLKQAFPAAQRQRSMHRSERASSLVDRDEVIAQAAKRAILQSAFPAPSTENILYNFLGVESLRH